METVTTTSPRRRGEPWAIGQVFGYASANIFDRLAVTHVDPLIGPLLRGLPSLLLGCFLVWKNHTFDQLRPGSPRFIGRRAILPFVLAGVLSTVGLFIYYFAIRVGGVIITVPALETYVVWGTIFAWFFLGEKVHGFVLLGVGLIAGGLVVLSLGQLRGQPISPVWYWAIPLGIFTALSYGISGALWREGQLRGAHQSTAILVQFVTSILVAVAGLVLLGHLSALLSAAWHDVVALLVSGVLSGIIGIYCMFTALRLMSVARVYAFSALTPLIAAVFAYIFLNEYLSGLMLAGVVAVSIGVILTQLYRPREERQA